MDDALARVETLLELRRSREAETVVRNHLAENGGDGPGLRLLARCLLEQERYREAVRAAQSAVTLDPDSGGGHQILALALSADGQVLHALRAAREAVQLSPWDSLSFFVLADVHRELGQAATALKHVDEAVRIAPHDPSAHNLRGLILLDRMRESDARSAFEEALRVDPGNAEALNNLAILEMDAGRLPAASQLLTSGLANDPQGRVLQHNLDVMTARLFVNTYQGSAAALIAVSVLYLTATSYWIRFTVLLIALVVVGLMVASVVDRMPRGARRRAFLVFERAGLPRLGWAVVISTTAALVIGLAPLMATSPRVPFALPNFLFVMGVHVAVRIALFWATRDRDVR